MNKRQIKKELEERLSQLVEELVVANKRGNNKKFKGTKQNLRVKDKKKYASTLAAMISGSLAKALQSLVLDSMKFSQTNETQLIRQIEAMLMQSGVKFPSDRDDIISTELSQADFSQANLTWSSNKAAVEGQFQFPVMGESKIVNPEYGDEDVKKGRIVHTVMFRLGLGKEELKVTGLDVVWK